MRYPVAKKMLFSDMMFAKKTKSLRQHTCVQIFMDGIGFTHAYPMKKTSEARDRLEKLLRTLQTIPEMLVTDGAAEETGGGWKWLLTSTGFKTRVLSHTHHGRIELNARFGS
jgi:hypothetical protein